MVSLNVFYQDLSGDAQGRLSDAVQRALLARGEVDYRDEEETEEEFQQRLAQQADDYINRHNFANEFSL